MKHGPLFASLCLFAIGCTASGVGSSDRTSPPALDDAGLPTAPSHDAGAPAAAIDAALGSRCVVGPTVNDVACDHQSTTIAGRAVLWETPLGAPPAGGWPVAFVYQGSLFSPDGASLLAPHGMWAVRADDAANDGPFASCILAQLTTQTTLVKRLLDGGYAVVTPTADGGGFAWDTNLPPWLFAWDLSPDSRFLHDLFAAVDAGALGPLSASRWYATGVSSGGYMTSRMAVSYEGRFRALAIAAGSYATCAGGWPTCLVPSLPSTHPPTLFLHGAQDFIVPLGQMLPYHDALSALGLATKAVIDPDLGHGWIPAAPDEIVAWFDAH